MSKESYVGELRPLPQTTNLLLLHDSVGAQLLADPGEIDTATDTHPNGGGLRRALTANGYRVRNVRTLPNAGDHIPFFGWLAAFQNRMDEILHIGSDGARLPNGEMHRVVLFKSCFTYNWFVGPGQGPGDAKGPELTEANARAMYRALLAPFAARPDVLFVALTTPPLPPFVQLDTLPRQLLKHLGGFPQRTERLRAASASARRFADFLVAPDGWLSGYEESNVAVFDLFDTLADSVSNAQLFPTEDGYDAHPTAVGNARVTNALVPFLNREVRSRDLGEDDWTAGRRNFAS
jgi:hypothetical protein